MPDDSLLREHLLEMLHGGSAHIGMDDVVNDFPIDLVGVRPEGMPHSAWELLEHIRIAQEDILRFSQAAGHESPPWPKGYWPNSPEPKDAAQWHASVGAIWRDLADFETLVRERDLLEKFPWGDGQTLAREAMLLAGHNSYHLGQLLLVKRTLGA